MKLSSKWCYTVIRSQRWNWVTGRVQCVKGNKTGGMLFGCVIMTLKNRCDARVYSSRLATLTLFKNSLKTKTHSVYKSTVHVV